MKTPHQNKKPEFTPDLDEVRAELKRVKHQARYRKTLRSTINVLIVVAAISILTATLWLPVLEIYGTSMAPTLNEGEMVASVKGGQFETGDIIAFYYNNKILVKRVIAKPGDWVDIERDGTVHVNGEPLDEPYVEELAFGDTDIDLPYQVPDGRWFVMGDHRSVSVDSRNKSIGTVAEEQVVGKLVYRFWPFKTLGSVN